MASVNCVILIGNLTRDPQTRQLPNGGMVTDLGMAMNRKFKGGDGEEREEVCFIDLAAFGRQAEVLQKYCKKGKQLYVQGRMRWDSWEDKQGGGKRSKITVVIENFQFLGGKEDGPGDHDIATPSPSVKNWDKAKMPTRDERGVPQAPFGDNMEFKEADIPF